MLHKLDLGNEHAVGFSWDGKFDQKAFKQSLVQFLPELQSRSKMNIYLEIYEISDVEARAVWDDLKFSINNFKELTDKIDKVALVTNETWLRNIAESSSILIPGISVKTFTFTEKEAGKSWLLKE